MKCRQNSVPISTRAKLNIVFVIYYKSGCLSIFIKQCWLWKWASLFSVNICYYFLLYVLLWFYPITWIDIYRTLAKLKKILKKIRLLYLPVIVKQDRFKTFFKTCGTTSLRFQNCRRKCEKLCWQKLVTVDN